MELCKSCLEPFRLATTSLSATIVEHTSIKHPLVRTGYTEMCSKGEKTPPHHY